MSNKDFINYCNVRKYVLMDQYKYATPEEIVSLLVHEYNSLTPLPPQGVYKHKNIIRQTAPTTISGLLFLDKK